jgi:UDP-3-O-[3-hydroxymyristoyl] glucosamine N-acyltransferase
LSQSYSLAHLAQYLDAELVGDPNYVISGIATLQSAGAEHISFVSSPAFYKYLPASTAGALILQADVAETFAGHKLVVANPYVAYARLTALFDVTATAYPAGIHATAVVGENVQMGAGVHIGAYAVIGANVTLGDAVIVSAGTVIGDDTVIGARTRLAPNVTVYHGISIGADCLIHSGAVIGADGFGFAPYKKEWIKIHQLGGVVIGNRVEIGANCTIDRGALDNTILGDGVKLDNLVHIAHNVSIGNNTAMAALSGVAGSTVIGQNCTFAGQVGISGHLNIANDVHVSGKSLVNGSLTEAGSYSSCTPIAPTREWRRNAVRFRQLENMATRIKQLEKSFKDL